MRTKKEIEERFENSWNNRKDWRGKVDAEIAVGLLLFDIREAVLDIRDLLIKEKN